MVGYTRFSWIIDSDGGGTVAASCWDMLLMFPNILIMDEGHTARNESTNVLESLCSVHIPPRRISKGMTDKFTKSVKETLLQ